MTITVDDILALVRQHGYNLRVTNRWLTIAIPVCPNPQCDEQGEPMEIG